MKTLVMGGSYFIGWHLVQELAKTGHDVWVFNRGTRGRKYPQNVRHIQGDRNDVSAMRSSLGRLQVDAVFDLTAYRGEQTAVMLDIFGGRVAKYLHISTAAVYLQSDIFPIREDFATGRHHIWGTYGGNKLDCENLLLEAHRKYGFPAVVFRPSYVYGPDNYIPRERFLYERISRSRPILIPDDGQALIQLGHVEDLAKAWHLALDNPKSIGEVYNVSGNEYITLDGLARLVSDIMKRDVEIVHVDLSEYKLTARDIFPFDNCTYFTDIEKAKSQLGFVPQIGLREGLAEGLQLWFHDDNRSQPSFEKEDQVLAAMGLV